MEIATFFILLAILGIVSYIWYKWPIVIYRYFIFVLFWLGFVFVFYTAIVIRVTMHLGEPPQDPFIIWVGSIVLLTGAMAFLVTFSVIAFRMRSNPNTEALIRAIEEADRRLTSGDGHTNTRLVSHSDS